MHVKPGDGPEDPGGLLAKGLQGLFASLQAPLTVVSKCSDSGRNQAARTVARGSWTAEVLSIEDNTGVNVAEIHGVKAIVFGELGAIYCMGCDHVKILCFQFLPPLVGSSN